MQSTRTPVSLLILFSLLITLCGCSRESNYLIPELANTGPHPLSSKNAYVSPNLLLATEIANSKSMDGLTKQAGYPDAIEVEKGGLQPYQLSLYYVRDKQRYVLQRYGTEWIVSGPEQIPPDRLRMVQTTGRVRGNPNPALVPGGLNSLGDESQAKAAAASASQPQEDKPIFVDLNKPTKKKHKTPHATPKPDITHRVQGPETLEEISRWYTEDVSNSAAIGRINNIDPSVTLQVGQEVRIPSYMVKQTAPMPKPKPK